MNSDMLFWVSLGSALVLGAFMYNPWVMLGVAVVLLVREIALKEVKEDHAEQIEVLVKGQNTIQEALGFIVSKISQ